MSFAPSQLVRPLLPASLNGRFGSRLDAILTAGDRIWAGADDKAVDQRSSLVAFAIRVVSAAIAFISQVFLARWMGGFEYGIFVWVWVAAVLIGSLACLGLPAAVVRFIPQYRQSEDKDSLRGIAFGAPLFAVFSASFLALIGIAGLWLFESRVESIYVWPFFLGAICLPMLALAEVQSGIARSFTWMGIALSPTFLIRPVLLPIFFFLATLFGFQSSANTALGAAIVATYLTTLFQLAVLTPRLGRKITAGKRQYHPAFWASVALPIFLIEGFFNLILNVDILIAGMFLDPQRVAIYFATVKTLAIVHFVYFAVKAASAHRIAQYYHAGDHERYHSFIRDTVKWTFWPSVLMAIIILLVGKYLLALFGPEFVEGQELLVILVVGILARASVGPAESVLTMSGKQNACAAIYGATLFINIVLNLTLIPLYGLYGAAIATTISLIFEAFALFAAAKRLLNINVFVLSAKATTEEAS